MRPHMHRTELIRLRHKAGLTQEQAAEIVGKAARSWIRYEAGSARVPHYIADMAKEGFPCSQAAPTADPVAQPSAPAPPVQTQPEPPIPGILGRLIAL